MTVESAQNLVGSEGWDLIKRYECAEATAIPQRVYVIGEAVLVATASRVHLWSKQDRWKGLAFKGSLVALHPNHFFVRTRRKVIRYSLPLGLNQGRILHDCRPVYSPGPEEVVLASNGRIALWEATGAESKERCSWAVSDRANTWLEIVDIKRAGDLLIAVERMGGLGDEASFRILYLQPGRASPIIEAVTTPSIEVIGSCLFRIEREKGNWWLKQRDLSGFKPTDAQLPPEEGVKIDCVPPKCVVVSQNEPSFTFLGHSDKILMLAWRRVSPLFNYPFSRILTYDPFKTLGFRELSLGIVTSVRPLEGGRLLTFDAESCRIWSGPGGERYNQWQLERGDNPYQTSNVVDIAADGNRIVPLIHEFSVKGPDRWILGCLPQPDPTRLERPIEQVEQPADSNLPKGDGPVCYQLPAAPSSYSKGKITLALLSAAALTYCLIQVWPWARSPEPVPTPLPAPRPLRTPPLRKPNGKIPIKG